jgi:hypothetical protein
MRQWGLPRRDVDGKSLRHGDDHGADLGLSYWAAVGGADVGQDDAGKSRVRARVRMKRSKTGFNCWAPVYWLKTLRGPTTEWCAGRRLRCDRHWGEA